MMVKKGFSLIELMIVVCIVAILSAIAVPNFVEAETRADVAQVREDLKRVSMALSGYHIDYPAYPFYFPFTVAVGYEPAVGVTRNINRAWWDASGRTGSADSTNISTFAVKSDHAIGLTTPVAYLPSYISDPFGSFHPATYRFVQSPKEYVLWSGGPDGFDQLDGGTDSTTGHNASVYIVRGGQALPSPYLIAGPMSYNSPPGAPASGTGSFTYDPTNGTASRGDIWRVRRGAI